MITCPCKGCENRHTLCHAECEPYKEYRAQLDAANRRRREESLAESYTIDVQFKIHKALHMMKKARRNHK